VDGNTYEAWLVHTADTSGIFAGESERTYAFYSIAIDNTGNVEQPPDEPDATVTPPKIGWWIWVTIGVVAVGIVGAKNRWYIIHRLEELREIASRRR